MPAQFINQKKSVNKKIVMLPDPHKRGILNKKPEPNPNARNIQIRSPEPDRQARLVETWK